MDENLSLRLVELLADLYPESNHVHNLNLGGADDSEVWDFAKLHGFAIVSKDSDFAERSVLEKNPPKIIWIRLGVSSVVPSNRSPILTGLGCIDLSED